MSSDPDRLLVEQAKLNDQAAFEALWRRHSLRIAGMVRVLFSETNHVLFAEDTVLEIFRRAFKIH